MLTGDKMETAENIAKSCRLIQQDFHILRLKLHDKVPKIETSRILSEKEDTEFSTIVLKELKSLSAEAD
jgi:phospholipid-transporting ATPase